MSIVRPAKKPPEPPGPPTPDTVIHHGWREKPYLKADMCLDCEGWGTRKTTVDKKTLHRTCPTCKGRARVDVPPAEGKVG